MNIINIADIHPDIHPSSFDHLQSIETTWNGFRFRSRLEARWAVFMMFMEIEYQYEVGGFRFKDGTFYLPDFFFPQIKMWGEVKPMRPTPEEHAKARRLVLESEFGLLWLIGPPDFRDYIGVTPDAGELTSCEYRLDVFATKRIYYEREGRLFAQPGEPMSEDVSTHRYREAIYASRAARFDGTDQAVPHA